MSPLPEVTALLRGLVAIPSVSGDERAVADHVQALCAQHGVDCERVGDSLVARLAGRRRGPRLLFNSHLDTVPVGEGWSHEPYGECWADGRLFGRGANDAKASVAGMLWALLDLAENGAVHELHGELWLALTACEETSNGGMAAVLERFGSPDAGVTGEPTGLEVVRAQAGLAVVEAHWSGRSCHAAHVSRVEHTNALHAAARELGRGPAWWALEGEHALLGKSTVALTVLHSGERHNVVPDRARAVFDARLVPPHRALDVVALLEEALPGAEVSVRSERLKPVETDASHALVTTALCCAQQTAALGSMTLSDMALLPGIPAIKCGPGQTARSHTPDEFVLAWEVEAGARFYRALAPAALEALARKEVPA